MYNVYGVSRCQLYCAVFGGLFTRNTEFGEYLLLEMVRVSLWIADVSVVLVFTPALSHVKYCVLLRVKMYGSFAGVILAQISCLYTNILVIQHVLTKLSSLYAAHVHTLPTSFLLCR